VALSGFWFPVAIHDFEDVAIGLPEEESFERRFPDRINKLCSMGKKALLERFKFGERIVKGEVSPEFGFESGGFKVCDVEDVQLLPVAYVKPRRLNVDVAGARD